MDFTVIVNSDCVSCKLEEIEVSKAVTANRDGVNDMFAITGTEFCDFTFDVMIFNRKGNEVYHGKDYQNNWGGASPDNKIGKSGMLLIGTYYYIIKVIGEETDEKINGYIYLASN